MSRMRGEKEGCQRRCGGSDHTPDGAKVTFAPGLGSGNCANPTATLRALSRDPSALTTSRVSGTNQVSIRKASKNIPFSNAPAAKLVRRSCRDRVRFPEPPRSRREDRSKPEEPGSIDQDVV